MPSTLLAQKFRRSCTCGEHAMLQHVAEVEEPNIEKKTSQLEVPEITHQAVNTKKPGARHVFEGGSLDAAVAQAHE